MVEVLLQRDASPVLADHTGMTAYMFAAAYGSVATLRALFKARRGHDAINARDVHGRTALHWALKTQSWGCFGILAKVSDAFTTDKYGCTVLHYIAQGGIASQEMWIKTLAQNMTEDDWVRLVKLQTPSSNDVMETAKDGQNVSFEEHITTVASCHKLAKSKRRRSNTGAAIGASTTTASAIATDATTGTEPGVVVSGGASGGAGAGTGASTTPGAKSVVKQVVSKPPPPPAGSAVRTSLPVQAETPSASASHEMRPLPGTGTLTL